MYRDPKHFWDLYPLGKELTDLQNAFRLWRFRHVATVERIILQTQNRRHRRRQLLAQDRAVRSQPSRRIARRAMAGRVRLLGRLVLLDWMRFPDNWKLRTNL